MKKYISKDYIDSLLNKYLDRWFGPEHYACSIIQDELDDVPNSEVIYMQECSVCGGAVDTDLNYEFCPYCGKPMEVELNGRN
jgi:rubrerythrin